ncbi:hypothetical protein BJY52DRAFT_1325281 [Lactarius psammicola]|nr:hypothetical protein BJY52DRAFT_1325281 [Lactarius psammicola]
MGDERPEISYYQIGGFRPNMFLKGPGGTQYDMRKLAQAIFGPRTSVELVFGIRPSGASSILVPASECVRKEVFSYSRTPQPASDFLSLSPLQYSDASQLVKRLNALKPKGKRRGEDDSAANKIFLGDTGQAGHFRSTFEYNRLFFHALNPSCSVWRYGLSRSSPWATAQVVSVVFNEWSHEKGVILDIGWSFLDCCTHPPTFRSSVHLEVEEKRNLGNRGKQRVGFRFGQSEVLKQTSVPARVQDLLRRKQPLVLLTYDEGTVRTLLGDLGIHTDDWTSGLEDLLRAPRSDPRDGKFRHQPTKLESRRRSRSRSPQRDEKSYDQRRPSPSRAGTPVCIIDVRQMYVTLRRRITESTAPLAAVATELGLPCDDKSMCAGNESRLLAEMWTAMASGPPIDEQYDARWGSDTARSTPVSGAASGVSTPLDADHEELDPNDLAPMGSEAAVQPPKSQWKEWDDLDDDEEEFYGR